MMLYNLIDGVFRILEIAIIVECLASWIPQARYSRFMDIIHSITAPILEPCRKLQYRFLSNMPVDFSPLIALLIMDVIRGILVALL
ncbi:MAG: YggT family protein [Clostridium sp.]|nr:YggT family protein [Clostridium sp.]